MACAYLNHATFHQIIGIYIYKKKLKLSKIDFISISFILKPSICYDKETFNICTLFYRMIHICDQYSYKKFKAVCNGQKKLQSQNIIS